MSKVLYEGQKGGSLDVPDYCDAEPQRLPWAAQRRRPVHPSKMFTIKLELQTFERNNPGEPVYDASQGDGGLSLGGIPPKELSAALERFLPVQHSTKYGDPVGRADVRRAVFESYYRFDATTGLTPDHVVMGDGGRDLLQKWYQFLVHDSQGVGGNVIVSAAPWASYTQGPYVSGLNILRAPGSPDQGFQLTPEAVDAAVERSRADGRPAAGLVLTSPDNPTGNYMPADRVIALVEHAVSRGVGQVFVDLVYQAVTDPEVGLYDVNAIFLALSPEARARVVFMDSLTKAAGASNLRSAHLVCGSADAVLLFKGIATHTVLPNAIGEAAALEVYGAPDPMAHPWIRRVVEPTAESRRLVQCRFTELGYRFIADQGYYAFVNVWPWLGRRIPRERIFQDPESGRTIDRVESASVLKSYLTSQWGVAIIHGTVFKQPEFIRFSYANAPEYTEACIERFHAGLSSLD